MKKIVLNNVNYLLIRGGGLSNLLNYINKGFIKTIEKTNRNISLSL